jgi:hypothetical protein
MEQRRYQMSSWRIKVGNDPTVEEWLKAQKSKSGSVQFLIKIFAHLHGNSDITKMSFNELFETGECNEQRYEVTGEAKVGAKPPLPVEKKSQEQREPSQKEKKKDNMLLSML